jgi:AmmeMemoRadiSam system protein B/AmmeMemoRadiSam system protein A
MSVWLVLALLLGASSGAERGAPAEGQPSAQEQHPMTRPAYCAGSWYPGEAAALRHQVTAWLDEADGPDVNGSPRAIISPHAGYRYSGPVAAAAYRSLRGDSFRRVILIGFSHRRAQSYIGVDVPVHLGGYETPLGTVPIDREACLALAGNKDLFLSEPGMDAEEHSLELQLPFLQVTLGDFQLIPLMIGQLDTAGYAKVAEALLPFVDDDTLLVVSTDFTHYGEHFQYLPFQTNAEQNLTTLADRAAAPLLEADFDGFAAHLERTRDTICGRRGVLLLLRILSMQGGAQAVRAGFDISGKQSGNWQHSVTYQSFVFTDRPDHVSSAARVQAFELARQAAEAELGGSAPPVVDASTLPAVLQADGACFVTLENGGRLRGCIGTMQAREPLYRSIMHNAVNACRDFRFAEQPVTREELDDLEIEISVLTPMERVEQPEEIIIGRHGLMIHVGTSRGVLLPQVAARRGWLREEFLAQTCKKAGLPTDAWRSPSAKIFSFEAEVFNEHDSAAASRE